VLLLGIASHADARPAHKKALADYLGPFFKVRLNDCRTCHLPDAPGATPESEEKPHNAFGTRLKELRNELKKAGKPHDLPARLDALAEEDSDGDGVPNLIELLTGHFPGDAKDKPTDEEVAASRRLLVEFRKSRASYPWTPFAKVQRPPLPKLKSTSWVRNPLDAFLAAEHEERGLTPRPEATKSVLLRRLYLDLVGLPPTPAELNAFLADTSPDAYEKVVDKLLADKRYGERWGRHWMDVWRYSDWAGWTGGNQIRDSQRHIWRWRDWIIESLNDDKGYDRMVVEMLAGDEVAPGDEKTLRATGYLVRNYKMLSREKWLQDTVEHTFLGFLGTTIGCARCHDHMFDPITQREYYQVRAIFEPHQVRTVRVPGEPDIAKDGLVHAYDANAQAPTYLLLRGDDRTPDRSKPISPGVPESMGGHFPKIEPVNLPPSMSAPDKRDFVIAELLATSEAALKAARNPRHMPLPVLGPSPWPQIVAQAAGPYTRTMLAANKQELQLAELKHKALKQLLDLEKFEDAGTKSGSEWEKRAMEMLGTQRQVALLEAQRNLDVARQNLDAATEKTKPGLAQKLAEAEKALAKAEADVKAPLTTAYTRRPMQTFPATSTGRRLAFARWIADRDNPLAARVAMNHLWLRHFGQALVPRVFDFGRNAQAPTHPALLDWLAVEFMERGWSMKAMHRLIATSSAYRMASTPEEKNLALDRDNHYYWRMNSRRLEAEVVRDCVFYVAGKLDLTMGGSDLDHNLGLTVPRRSLYFRHAAEKQMEFLKLFDAASVTECYQRKESVLPQQALALSNSDLVQRHGRLLARSLHAKHPEATAFVKVAFEAVLARPVTADEERECVEFLRQQTERNAQQKTPAAAPDADGKQPASDPALRARESLVQVLLNHNDFVTVR
jgi:hypothetical protein